MPLKLKALCCAPALALVALAFSAPPASAECTPAGQNAQVCLTGTSQPSPSAAPSGISGTPSYVQFTGTVTNNGPTTVNHTVLSAAMTNSSPTNVSAQGAFISTPGCTVSGDTANCAVGSLAAGRSASFTLVVQAPALIDPTQVDQFMTFSIVFDERLNDNPSNGGKVDTVATAPVVAITGAAGTTFVPPNSQHGGPVGLTTSATGSNNPTSNDQKIAHVSIPTLTNGFVASLTEPLVGTPSDCTTFTGSDGKTHICRGNGWFQSTVPGYPVNGKFLVYDLYWDASVVPATQTFGNFEVFHAINATDTPLQWEILATTQKCKNATDPGPCFVAKPDVNANGDWHAAIHRPSNGYMR